MQDIVNNLTVKTKKAFEKAVEAMNKNVVSCEKDADTFSRPMPILSDGGCTVICGQTVDSASFSPPATVKFDVVKVAPYIAVYRVAFNVEDAARAAEDDTYFNTVFVPVLNEAIKRYKLTFGDENVIRYGDYFLKLSEYLDLGGEYAEIRLQGSWASDKVVQ